MIGEVFELGWRMVEVVAESLATVHGEKPDDKGNLVGYSAQYTAVVVKTWRPKDEDE